MHQFQDLFGVALRASIMYLYAMVFLRLTGKRSLGSLTPFDFAVTTIMGDLFDDVIWAEISITQGLVAFSTIVILHTLVSFIAYRNPTFHALVSSLPAVVVKKGRLVREAMNRERTPQQEVAAQLRLTINEESPGEVLEARWEPSGQLSVIRQQEAKTAQKKDLPRLREVFK